MSLNLAIFDVDGTLVDSRELITTTMRDAFASCGMAPPAYADIRQTIGLPLDGVIAALAPGHARPHQLIEAYRDAFVKHRKTAGFVEPLYAGALPMLQRLAAENWVIGIATGKSRRGLAALFEMHPIARFFDTIWCADDGPGKPNPFMVLEAAGSVGVALERTVMIGDAVHDMQMGQSAGVRSLAVSWGFGAADELLAAGADEVLHNFETLNDSLDKFTGV